MALQINTPNILWKTVKNTGIFNTKIIESMNFKNKIFGDMFLKRVASDNSGFNWLKFAVFNRCGKEFGYEILKISAADKEIIGANIFIHDEYRKKYRLGEVLRLASIMHMVENKIGSIKITSKDSALYFHARYGFKPDFKEFYARDRLLEGISKDKSFPELAKEALKLIARTNDPDPANQRAVCKEANELLKRYIELALKSPAPEKHHPPRYSVDMSLKRDDVLANREFYNQLFERNSIDYRI